MLKFPSYKSTSSEAPPGADPKRVVSHYRPTLNDEAQLASSDLEDCEEVWIEELSDYVLETQKRQNEVEKWFEASVLVSKLISLC
jgi:DNA helicase INO80